MSENANEGKGDPSDVKENRLLFFLASKPLLTIGEAVALIQGYIFEKKGERVAITDISNVDLFEKAVTTACNYYGRHK
jgi:hypothetical protein